MKAWFTVDEMNAWADKKLKENPHWNEASEKQDIPDLIAGALGVSRGTAYDMMREALAEQPAQQEPVACQPRGLIDIGRVFTPEKAEEPKPVAWKKKGAFNFCNQPPVDVEKWIPLYTTPPHRKPLTDEQIEQCMKQAYATVQGRNLEHAFARAIEAAHQIGVEK